MRHFFTRMITLACLLLALVSLSAPRPAAAAEEEIPVTMPVDLTADTLRVGPGGTETLATDLARVFLGKGALLARDVTLSGVSAMKKPVTEKLRLRAELRPTAASESNLVLVLKSRIQVLALAGEGQLPRGDITRTVSLEIARGTSELVTLYESPSLGTKVALNIKWALAGESDDPASDASPIEFAARVFQVGESSESLLADNRLMAMMGIRASTTFDQVVPLTGKGDKKVRQDRLEVFLTPRYRSAHDLSLALEIGGQVVTLTPDGDFSHPVALQGNYLLSPGLPVSAEVEVHSDSEDKEGWSRVRFRIEVAAAF